MLGIIGGSGFYKIPWLQDANSNSVVTQYGQPSSPLTIGVLENDRSKLPIAFLARHGKDHKIPPHKVNYRANVQAMVDIGVKKLISINSVGACDALNPTGSIVMPDQIIDYSYGREHTFFDELQDFSSHVDFTQPFSQALREAMLKAAKEENIQLVDGGTYGCMQGPRLETAAEVRRLKQDGCDLVGMTLMPEAALCRERNIDTISLCIVVNPAAGVVNASINFDEITSVMRQTTDQVERLVRGFCLASI